MADKAQIFKSINCTQCGAPVTLFGGGRKIQTLTCGYCGSTLDAKKEYAVLKKYAEMKRPYMPLKLGQVGVIKGIEFIVIGVIEYLERVEHSRWLEYQLFSATHGYAWLEYDNGHFILGHKTHDLPETAVQKQARSRFQVRDRTYKVIDFYTARATYVEGELTWQAKQDDIVSLIDAIAPPYAYSIETSNQEIEYFTGEYLQQETVIEAFKLRGKLPSAKEIHAAQPYIPSTLTVALGRVGWYFLPVSIVLLLLVWIVGSGTTILSQTISTQDYLHAEGTLTQAFAVEQADRLIKMELQQDLDNAWNWYDIEVVKNDEPVFSLSQQISYYHGFEGGESWSEGSTKISTYFKVPEVGEYSLRVLGEGGSGNWDTHPQNRALYIKLKEGVIVSRYLIVLMIIVLIAISFRSIKKFLFEGRRWQAYSEDDDD